MHKRGSFEDTLSIISMISIEQKNRRVATRRLPIEREIEQISYEDTQTTR